MTNGYGPPRSWTTLRTIDLHTAGEPLRIITDGYPDLPGKTMLEKRRNASEHHDHLRRALMLEPKGHADMYGCVLTRPVTDDGDAGVIFMHNEGYSTMCGHGIIALVKASIECRLFEPRHGPEDIRFDTPAGRVTAKAVLDEGSVTQVLFCNVPSFVLHSEREVVVDGLGTVPFTVAFGGAFYAYVDARSVGVELRPEHYRSIVDRGMRIKQAVSSHGPIEHPEGEEDLNYLYGTIFIRPAGGGKPVRNVCVFADGEVDRSPTGTGVSGLAAILHQRGELRPGERRVVDSLIGTSFEVGVIGTTRVGDRPAVVPEVCGIAHLTGRHEFWIDPTDPLVGGVLLR